MKRIVAILFCLAMAPAAGYGQLRSVTKSERPPRAVPVAVTPWGFEPRRIEMQEGPFALRIRNRSLASGMTFALTREKGGAALLTKQQTPRQYSVEEVIDPEPGTYHLTVVEHPKWDMTIVIKPKP